MGLSKDFMTAGDRPLLIESCDRGFLFDLSITGVTDDIIDFAISGQTEPSLMLLVPPGLFLL